MKAFLQVFIYLFIVAFIVCIVHSAYLLYLSTNTLNFKFLQSLVVYTFYQWMNFSMVPRAGSGGITKGRLPAQKASSCRLPSR